MPLNHELPTSAIITGMNHHAWLEKKYSFTWKTCKPQERQISLT